MARALAANVNPSELSILAAILAAYKKSPSVIIATALSNSCPRAEDAIIVSKQNAVATNR